MDLLKDIRLHRHFKLPLLVYVLCSLALLAQLFFLHLHGHDALARYAKLGPLTDPYPLMTGMVSVWLLLGVALCALAWNRVNRATVVFCVGFLVTSLVYANILRERIVYYDVVDYVQAASAIAHGEHFSARYAYPPLWASILAVFRSFAGDRGVYLVCYAVNMASLWVFFGLIVLWLRRMGLSLHLASAVAFGAMILNVPILRNLCYVQLNLLVADLILGALLLYPRFPVASAVLLALGMHLKVVPLVFVPLFLGRFRWRWLTAFGLSMAALVAFTACKDGLSYYRDFVANILDFGQEISPRSSSIDCWTKLLLIHTAGSIRFAGAISAAIKCLLVVATYALAVLSMRRVPFVRSADPDSDRAINGGMPLFFLMVILFPSVWVYHLTWLIAPVLALTLTLQTPRQLSFFLCAYAAVFFVPAFDLFPWSIARLIGWLALYALMADAILRPRQGTWWSVTGKALERLLNPNLATSRNG